MPVALEELILRFPSAPLHGFQRLHEHHVMLGISENFHSFRVLRSADPAQQLKPIDRIFLMHTGLNERDTMGLYYRLASQLVKSEPSTVCIVRPFPGHMTRYPFQAFGETPLDRYLADGSHLFRQFLRFMIETQWLLSAIVRRSSYRSPSGADLLGESAETATSRLNPEVLADVMFDAWMALHRASAETFAAEGRGHQPKRPLVARPIADREMVLQAITTLRDVLNLERDYPPCTGDLTTSDEQSDEPTIHVLGYSLGGFAAQSVFMSWPFLVSSCATVLAGGALRELAPTAFADPEEWQTVLHSLRYELDDRMMSPYLGVTAEAVAGVSRDHFTYFKRTFYEVFQQEYRGSFQSRLEAFRQRMLFIVGGNDPVVRPQTVLESAPKGGLNLLEIGGLGHFLGERASNPDEEASRSFWLPEMAALINRFAGSVARTQAAERPVTWFDADMKMPERTSAHDDDDASVDGPRLRRLSPAELIAINREGALPGGVFERCLEDLLDRVALSPASESGVSAPADEGVLFALRNEIPHVLLHPSVVREKAAAMYHDDLSIAKYCQGVAVRRRYIERHIDRICVVLPWNARSIMTYIDINSGYPSQSESAGGQVAERLAEGSVWEEAERRCHVLTQAPGGAHSVRMFDGNPILPETSELGRLLKLAEEYSGREPLERVASMPDCWVWMSRRLLFGESLRPTIGAALNALPFAVPEIAATATTMRDAIQTDSVRIISVSRARYNPRFRGRLLVDARAARKLLLHAALCLCRSQSIADDGVAFS